MRTSRFPSTNSRFATRRAEERRQRRTNPGVRRAFRPPHERHPRKGARTLDIHPRHQRKALPRRPRQRRRERARVRVERAPSFPIARHHSSVGNAHANSPDESVSARGSKNVRTSLARSAAAGTRRSSELDGLDEFFPRVYCGAATATARTTSRSSGRPGTASEISQETPAEARREAGRVVYVSRQLCRMGNCESSRWRREARRGEAGAGGARVPIPPRHERGSMAGPTSAVACVGRIPPSVFLLGCRSTPCIRVVAASAASRVV